MSTQEIATRFDELAKENKWAEIAEELFSPDAESVEPAGGTMLPTVKGMDAIREKGKQLNEMIEAYHGGYCTPSVVGGNHFSLAMGMEVTLKGAGRVKMDEICVYKVENGKIVKEQFFY